MSPRNSSPDVLKVPMVAILISVPTHASRAHRGLDPIGQSETADGESAERAGAVPRTTLGPLFLFREGCP